MLLLGLSGSLVGKTQSLSHLSPPPPCLQQDQLQQHKQGHACLFPVCMCVYLHHSTGFCQGTFDYPVLREPFPKGAWVISLWLLPVTVSPYITACTDKQRHTHFVHAGKGRYGLHVFPRQCEGTQFSISKQTGSLLSQPRPCGSN